MILVKNIFNGTEADTLGPANFGVILLLYRGCPLSKVKLYCHGPVGTTELVLYRRYQMYCVLNLEGPLGGSTVASYV